MQRISKLLRVCLLPLLVLTFAAACPGKAWALVNGEIEPGSITGCHASQSWTFTSTNTSSYAYVGVNSAPDSRQHLTFAITFPNSTNFATGGISSGDYGGWTGGVANQSGTYTITVSSTLGCTYPTFTSSYTIKVVQSGQTNTAPGGSGAGLVRSGDTLSATLNSAMIDQWTFDLTSGDRPTLTMSSSFVGSCRLIYFKPDGTEVIANTHTCPTTSGVVTAATTGTYTAWAFTSPNPQSVSYTFALSGSTALPSDGKPDGKKCLGCTGDQVAHNGGAGAGDPINVATGNMFETVTDYTTIGTNPLAFTRYYNSFSWQHNVYPSALGPNWRHNYDRYLRVVSASLVQAERTDGQVVNFNLVSSVWTPDADVDIKLTGSGSSYTLTDSNDVAEAYTVASGKGTLSSITWPNGYSQTLTYTSGKLTSVSDSYSRTLTLSYTGSDLTGVSTPDSATLTYGYTSTSGQDLLTSITYNTSPSTSQTYVYGNSNQPFFLTSITDENGNTNSQWTYDGYGRCTMSEHAGGADETQISYDDSTGYHAVTGPLGNVETYHFTADHNMNKVSSIVRTANSPVATATRNFTYDTNGYLATATDWNGNSTHWTNNSHGQPTSITEAYGTGRARTTSITYDSTWVHKPYTTTKTNVTIDDRYDGTTGTLTTHTLTDTTGGSTNGNTEVWAYTYNGTGEMLTETFPRTGTTVKNTYTYTSGALSSVTDQLSHTWTVNTANGTGQPTEITDPNGVVTDFVYNNRNWLTSKTVNASPSNEVTSYTYIASGQPDVITLPDSSTIDFDYDNAQRVTKIKDTAGESINYTLDAMGDVTALAIKHSGGTTRKSWSATYDVLGDRLTLVGSGGASQTTSYAYDGMRNRTSTTDANSNVWSQTWDELLRPTTVTDPLTHTAAPTYNNLDFITAQTDFLGYSTSYTRDAFGNAIARTSPDSGSWSFTFDEDNNLTGITDARSVATTNTFDAVDRLTGVSITGYSGEAESFTYDSTSGGNVGIGRLTSFSDESGSTTQTFDNFGNMTQTVRTIGGNNYTTSYSYDLANRVTQIVYPSGRIVNYTYDSSGYLTQVDTKPSSMGTDTVLASSITHKPFGPITGFTYGNSEALTKTYDNNYWLSTLNTVYSGTYVQELSYGYDYAGNLTSITDGLDSSRDETYTVDGLNRLHTASGAYGSRTYTYDNNSNRATRVAGATTYTSTMTSSTNLLASYTDGTNTRNFTYTANGNMATDDRTFIGGGSVSNTYGGRDRLESASVGGNAVTFTINALGQRVSKTFSGSTTQYHYDIFGHIIGESDGSGNNLVEYVWMEGQLLAQIDSSGNIVYVHSDQVNAPQKITDPSRTLVWDFEREPFGETYATPTNTTPTAFRFPGQYADAEDTLNYNGWRNQDPSTGRYNEVDPTGFRGGLNLFSYAFQNPSQITDPTGLDGVAVVPTPDGPVPLPVPPLPGQPGAPTPAQVNAAAQAIADAAAQAPQTVVSSAQAAVTDIASWCNNNPTACGLMTRVLGGGNLATQVPVPEDLKGVNKNLQGQCPFSHELPETQCLQGNRTCIYDCPDGPRAMDFMRRSSGGCPFGINPWEGREFTPISPVQ
jgi:RHS repeat-associated protein